VQKAGQLDVMSWLWFSSLRDCLSLDECGNAIGICVRQSVFVYVSHKISLMSFGHSFGRRAFVLGLFERSVPLL